MAIQVIPKPKSTKISWSTGLLVVCAILFVALAGSYVYLYLVTVSNEKSIVAKENDIRNLEKANRPLREELLAYERKINAFIDLLSKHKKTINIFSFLESKTHPDAWFTKFDLDTEKAELKVGGEALDFVTVGQQLMVFQGDQIIKNVTLSGLSLGEEGTGVVFDLLLAFDPQIFK